MRSNYEEGSTLISVRRKCPEIKKNDNDGILMRYFQDINKIRLLTREEEQEYARKAAAGDSQARETLIKANLRFVINISKQYCNQGLPLSDLISEGNIGLLNAIDRFDVERGFHFISYAVWWIRQSILKALYEKSRMIRIPLNRNNDLVQIQRVRRYYSHLNNKAPDATYVADKLGMKHQNVENLLNISRDLISIETPLTSKVDILKVGDIIEDQKNHQPEQAMLFSVMKDDINRALSQLSRRESDVVQARFGLNGRQRLSLREIGAQYRLTKERIRQIEKTAIRNLQHPRRSHPLRNHHSAISAL